ncbi:MAG: hypothetical protein JST00_04925 [Deltaproteobacteria bacterium]|nr:hypothetical protein [Deltaproteobacteria bacterium]
MPSSIPRSPALRLVSLVTAGGALALAVACSSDPASPPPGDTDAGGGGEGGSGGLDGGGGFETGPRPTCPDYTPRAGKANATSSFGALTDLPEITCRTLRRRDGSVVGYAASFGRFKAKDISVTLSSQMERIDRFTVTAYGPYTGDGPLAATTLTYRIQNQAGQNSTGTGGTLTLSDGGKKGTLAGVGGSGDSVDFTCDPSDDTAPTAGPALTDAPGRAIIERERGGDATAIDGIKCFESPSSSIANLAITYPYESFEVRDGPCVPSQIRIEVKGSGPGTYDVNPGSYVIWDLQELAFVGTSVNGKTAVTLTSVGPARGTFAGTTPGGAGGNNFNGSFTCPTP